MTTAILVTTKDRPESLARSLPQIAALGAPVLVVDDGTELQNAWPICEKARNEYSVKVNLLELPSNRGLACALNIGLSYWLADRSVDWISYFQDDVDVHPRCLEILRTFHGQSPILTGHDAAEHPHFAPGRVNGHDYFQKWSIRATHVHAHRDWWFSQMPFPTNELGTPKRKGPGRGMGSNVDWYFCRDGKNSCQKTGTPILCVPGLVRTFSLKAEDSTWNNAQKEEPPLRGD